MEVLDLYTEYLMGNPIGYFSSLTLALFVVMQQVRWPVPGAGVVATAILWQLGPKFCTKEEKRQWERIV
jgi:hypothetical protein